MDLLDDPSRIIPEEPVGIQTAVYEIVEMRGQLPMVVLHPPWVEDRDPCCGPYILEGSLDIPDQIVEFPPGLHETFDQLLRRGDDPMAYLPHIFALLLIKSFLTLKVASKLYQILLVDIAYAGTYAFMVDEHPWMRMNRNRNIPFSTRGRSLHNDIDLGPDGKPLFD